jgi:polysaccharide export outer membrane protein
MKNYYIIITLFLFYPLTSCISLKKQTYFQGTLENPDSTVFSNPIKNYLLRPGDVLFIKIISIDDRLSSFFNVDHGGNQNIQGTTASTYLQGYLVNDSGYIELPILGKFNAKGIPLENLREQLSKEVNQMVSTSTVIVKMATIKIVVSGEVQRPGQVFFNNERVSIIEALASSGDLTMFGNREKVEIIRQKIDGKFERGFLNLKDINVVHSPYFYLQPNDIIYVPPTRASTAKFNSSNISLFLAGISTLILVFSFVTR